MYRHVVVAGTFDRLHAGHQAVLARAFAVGERVTVGLTTDEYVRHYKLDKLAQLDKLDIKQYPARKKALELWLVAQKYETRATIVPLDDPYGFVVPQSPHDVAAPDIEAIVVSSQTRPRAVEINRLRREAGWKPLAIVEVAMVAAEDVTPISSTRVRKGEIDRKGGLMLPDNLRPELQKPLGRVLTREEIGRSVRSHLVKQGETFIVAVGDVAAKTLLDLGVVPSLAIIDGRVGRKPYADCYDAICKGWPCKWRRIKIKSGPGYISREAMVVIRGFFNSPSTSSGSLRTRFARLGMTQKMAILVDGEEDLLALPAIAEAPVGSVVYYGQPDQGLVEVVVTEEKKREAVALLRRFT